MTAPLITSLEQAGEGSRVLDTQIANHFDTPDTPHVTTSFDAAYAMAERVLPEMNCIGFDKTPLGVEAYVSRNNVESGHWVETGWHKSSPALALCIAILRANHKDKP